MTTDTRPLVSVCVAVYNHAKFIEDCLTSVLAQSLDARLEILVGDDCSFDGGHEVVEAIARKYPGSIRLTRQPVNIGAAENYRSLIDQASGDFVAHLDGDDYWLTGKLRKQLAFMAQNPTCPAVYGNAVVFSSAPSVEGLFVNRQPTLFSRSYLLRQGNFLNHSSLLYRAAFRRHLLSIPGAFIDYRIHLRLSNEGPLGFVNDVLVAYRVGHAAAMTRATPDIVHELYWDALREATNTADSRVARMSVRYFWRGILLNLLDRGKLASACSWSRRIRASSSVFSRWDVVLGALEAIDYGLRRIAGKLLALMARDRVKYLHVRRHSARQDVDDPLGERDT